MNITVVKIPNIEIELTLEQLIEAVQQLDTEKREQVAKALVERELDADLSRLIDELYSYPPIDDIPDDDILAEIQAVRRP